MHTTETERAKYEKMWAQPSYRINSPGLNIAPRVWELWLYPTYTTLRDYGAGEGKAINWFTEKGLYTDGVDLIKLHPKVREASLWDLPDDLDPTDYAFCADVMEHIPPEQVTPVLENIHRLTRRSAAFQIASCECTQGQRYGEELHLTIRDREWWENALYQFWETVEYHETDRDWRHLFICR